VRMAPDLLTPTSPAIIISLHPIGGFCSISRTLPMRKIETEIATRTVHNEGMNVIVGETVHCLAAEPHAVFFRVGVIDDWDDKEVAYEVTLLGRLRRGYRIIQLRGTHGTRIELCYLFVHVACSSQKNLWPTARQTRVQNMLLEAQTTRQDSVVQEQRRRIQELEGDLATLSLETSVRPSSCEAGPFTTSLRRSSSEELLDRGQSSQCFAGVAYAPQRETSLTQRRTRGVDKLRHAVSAMRFATRLSLGNAQKAVASPQDTATVASSK